MKFLLSTESQTFHQKIAKTPRVLAFIKKAVPSMIAVFFIGAICCSNLFFLGTKEASAASKKGYEAMQIMVSGSGTLTLQPHESKQVMVQFQNLGPNTWTNTGAKYVSVYTYNPKYRLSDFENGWLASDQPAKLIEASVPVGGVGTIQFTLTAPANVGVYKESFYLAAEETAWIPGGEFTFTINVQEQTTTTTKSSSTKTTSSSNSLTDGTASPVSTEGLSATVLLRSKKDLKVEAGTVIEYTVGIKNTGTVPWSSREVRTADLAMASVTSSETKSGTWLSASKLIAKAGDTVNPGALDFFTFSFTAPKTKGNHTVRYQLAVNETTVPDFYIDIPVEVTTGAPEAYESPLLEEQTSSLVNEIAEPIMRIGVLIVDEETSDQVIISCNADWELRDGTSNLMGTLEAGENVTAFYKKGKYWFNRGRGLESTSYYLRFIPKEEDAVCTVENFDRRVTRNTANADNTFRDVLELRYNDYKDRTWLINELPIEEYLYGLAETSNSSHAEYQKTLITVARTYALYHYERATKYKNEYFHISSYSWDQVYNGQGHEARSPRIVEAVDATRGVTVTYDGETAITPYFSRSDGRTRDWSEVWGGSVPWCQSVATPCDAGKTLWGHGVGLSASAALCMAKNGQTWDDILNYFYQGIDLAQRWE
ncbi:MAG: SpoIID/LytB domain protein [Candidatus Uhrbacteria bacterium GW2011_GWE2_40_58]|nr:MAG: SpoIID/LytB domain protein [Candidatus Uhrbacteria bacterium GW2011_GWF2_40_263]KKR67116.1 MAG: SpoIID/LytB domain protein [Candidatus Uhrbacteria bacterium GW2011_GWE2_40_58]